MRRIIHLSRAAAARSGVGTSSHDQPGEHLSHRVRWRAEALLHPRSSGHFGNMAGRLPVSSTPPRSLRQGQPKGNITSPGEMSSVECLLEGDAVRVADEGEAVGIDAKNKKKLLKKKVHKQRRSERENKEPSSDLSADDDNGREDEDSEDDDDYELTWRLDPQTSLSDWTIHIAIKGEEYDGNTRKPITTTYHVHKSVLAVGPRRSTYFAAAFQNQLNNHQGSGYSPQRQHLSRSSYMDLSSALYSKMSKTYGQASPTSILESAGVDPFDCIHDGLSQVTGNPASLLDSMIDLKSNSNRLELEPLAAEAIPAVLDFMYSSTGQLDIHTNNASALHYLSQLLGIKLLRRKVKDFWAEDLNMDNVCTYYEHACIFHDEKIIAHAEQYCSVHIFDFNELSVVEVLNTVNPTFFLHVITSPSIGRGQAASLRLSLLVAVYCNLHRKELTKSTFNRLTAAEHLPALEVKAAKILLEMEDEIGGYDISMSSLKERCIAVLSENWDTACILTPNTSSSSGNGTSSTDPSLSTTVATCTKGSESSVGTSSSTTVTESNQVSLPVLYGAPLEQFVSLSFLNAKKRLNRCKKELEETHRRNQELEKECDVLRQKIEVLQIKDSLAHGLREA